MIFKRRSKFFWVEAAVYLAIIIVCILGSYGVFDAKAQESSTKTLTVDICESWIEIPYDSRIMFLRYGIITELLKSNLEKEETDSLIECLSEYKNLKDLDGTIVNECSKGEEENVADVFDDKNLVRMVFRCMKWVNGEKE